MKAQLVEADTRPRLYWFENYGTGEEITEIFLWGLLKVKRRDF